MSYMSYEDQFDALLKSYPARFGDPVVSRLGDGQLLISFGPSGPVFRGSEDNPEEVHSKAADHLREVLHAEGITPPV